MATKDDPLSISSHMALGHAQASIGDLDEAVNFYNHIIRRMDDNYIPAYLAIASEYLRVRKPNLAAPYLYQALQLDRLDPFALNEFGLMLYVKGDLGNALQAFYKAERVCAGKLENEGAARSLPYGLTIRKAIEENIFFSRFRLAFQSRSLGEIRQIVEDCTRSGTIPTRLKRFIGEVQLVFCRQRQAMVGNEENIPIGPLLLEAGKITDRKRSLRTMERIINKSKLNL